MISCCDGIGHYPGLLTEVPSFKAGRQKALIAGCGGPGYRLTEGIFFTLSLSGSRDVSAYRFAATRMSTLLQAMPNLSTTQPS